MNNSLRVLYFDDVQSQLDGFGPMWNNILQKLFKSVEVEPFLNMSESVIKEKNPHIVIVDNVLITEEGVEIEDEGAKFISNMKRKYPHILFILFTQQTFSVRTLGSLYPNPDIIVPKISFRAEDYQKQWIIPKIQESLLCRPVGDIRFENTQLKREFMNLQQDIRCAFEQAFNDILYYEAGAIDEICVKKLTGGASGASVFLAEVSGLQRLRNVPIVFRFASESDIREEISNYKRYVALQIPHNVKVELLGSGFSGDYGGAIYAFALGDVDNTSTASDVLGELSSDDVTQFQLVCAELFDANKRGWYVFDNENKIEVVNYFSNSVEYANKKDNRRITGIQKNIQKYKLKNKHVGGDGIKFNGKFINLPRNILYLFDGKFIHKSICHGDMNLNNVIMSKGNNRVALIDFEYSGFDHIFKDFISLEVSLMKFANLGKSVCEVYENQLKNFDELDFEQTPGDVFQVVRHNFYRVFGHTELIDIKCLYLLCLAFHIFKVCALDVIEKKHFFNMFGSLCAAMEVLKLKIDAD